MVIPDIPGYGDSAPLTEPHTLANYAATLEALRVALDLGPVHLIGHSLGASIALLHAAAHATAPHATAPHATAPHATAPHPTAAAQPAAQLAAAQPSTVQSSALRSLTLLNPVSTANNVTANLGKLYYRVAAALPARAARFWLASKPAVYIADAMVIVSKDKAVRRRILDEDYENYARASVPAMIESFLSYYDTDFEAAGRAHHRRHPAADRRRRPHRPGRLRHRARRRHPVRHPARATRREATSSPWKHPADVAEPLAAFLPTGSVGPCPTQRNRFRPVELSWWC